MKNIAIINSVDRGSTGKIGRELLKNFLAKGYNTYFFYGRGAVSSDPHLIRFNNPLDAKVHVVMGKILGLSDNFSCISTAKLISKLRELQIDTIYMICPHGFYLNENLFYDYCAKDDIHLIHTMIDEYTYLGKCTNEPCCDTWKTGKGKCPEKSRYPASMTFDTCTYFLKRKAKNYGKVKRLLFVGPQFLVDRSKDAYLRQYMKMVHLDEAINLDLYRPRNVETLLRKHNIDGQKKIILFAGGQGKHPEYFTELARRFENDPDYCFVHVGYKGDGASLPANYITIGFVESDEEFASYYALADLFVFPSTMDCMPNTCLEALACGTPILVFDISGLPYLIDRNNPVLGEIVPPCDIDAMKEVVSHVSKKTAENIKVCREYAEERYDNKKYINRLIAITKENE